MKKQVKVLLLFVMILVMAAMTMLVSSALDAEQTDAHFYQVSGTNSGFAATLQEAYDGAAAGDTITVLKDATETAGLTIDKGIILDGNGKTIDLSALEIAITITNVTEDANDATDTVTFKNLTLKTKKAFQLDSDCVILLQKVTVNGTGQLVNQNHAVRFTAVDSSLITSSGRVWYGNRDGAVTDGVANEQLLKLAGGYVRFDGCTLSNKTSDTFSFEGVGTELSFNDCTITSGGTSGQSFLYSTDGGLQISVTGKTSITTSDRGIYPAGSGAEIDGVMYRNKVVVGSEDGGDEITMTCAGACFQVRGTGNELTVYSGTFTTNTTTGSNPHTLDVRTSASTINIYGGTFTQPESKPAVYITVDNTVLNIHNGTFNGGTYAIQVAKTAQITIDNGSFTGGTSAIYSAAVATIEINDGTFSTAGQNLVHFDTAVSTLTVNDGEFETTHATGRCIYANYAGCSVNLYGGTLNGYQGLYLAKQTNVYVKYVESYTVRQFIYCGVYAHDITIDGGKFITYGTENAASGRANIYTGTSGSSIVELKITINGGFFSYVDCDPETLTELPVNNASGTDSKFTHNVYISNRNAIVTINGGTFVNGNSNACIRYEYDGCEATINGGSFYGYRWLSAIKENSSLTVTGGEFKTMPGSTQHHGFNFTGFADTATLNISGGTFTVSNKLVTDGVANLTVTVTETERPNIIVNGGLWDYDYESFKECDFVVNSVAVDISPFENNLFGTGFDGTFNGSMEEFYAILAAALENMFCSDEVIDSWDDDTQTFTKLTWIVSEEMIENLGLDPAEYRQQVTINFTSFSGILVNSGDVNLTFTDFPAKVNYQFATVNGGMLTLNDITANASKTFAVVNGGELVLNNCTIESTANILVEVPADNCTLRVNGGTYTYNGSVADSFFFELGAENSAETDSYPNLKAYFKDATFYVLNVGGYAIVARGGEAYVENCYFTYNKDIVRGEFDFARESLYSGPSPRYLYAYGAYMLVKDSTLYAKESSYAISYCSNIAGSRLDLVNCEMVGYRIAYVQGDSCNIYGGNYYSNIRQQNHRLFDVSKAATLNIYGGNFNTVYHDANGSTDIGIIFVNGDGCAVNIYGGVFNSGTMSSETALVSLAYLGVKTSVTLKAAGTSYTDWEGKTQTSEGATLVRDGLGYIFKDVSGESTITLEAGATLRVSNGAAVVGTGAGTVFTSNGATIYVVNGGVMPEDTPMWQNTIFYVEGAASVEITSGEYTITNEAEAISVASGILTEQWKSNQYIKPNVNLFASISTYVPFFVKEGATLTFNANFAYGYELFTVAGGTVIINGGSYNMDGAPLATVESGNLIINGGTFTTTQNASYITLNGGSTTVSNATFTVPYRLFNIKDGAELTVNSGTFNKIDAGSESESFFYMQGGKLTVLDGNFTVENGGAIVYVSGGTTSNITVKGGTFKMNNNADNGVEAVCHIEGGNYTGTGFVRIYSVCTADGVDKNVETAAPDTVRGVKVYLTGDDIVFNGNTDIGVHTDTRYVFQIARAGAHLIEITGDITVTGTPYQVFFNANASACAIGGTFNIHGGSFDGGCNWILCNKPGVTFSLQNVTFRDSANTATASEGSHISITGTTSGEYVGDSLIIGEGTKLYSNTVCNLINFNNTHVATFNGGTFVITKQLFKDAGTNCTVNVNGGTFIHMGTETNVFRPNDRHINKAVVLTNSGAINGVELDAYAAEIKYAGVTYKVWVKNAATDATLAPEVATGAGLFVSTESVETSGIRFKSTITKSVFDALTEAGYTLVGYGTLIAPADYVAVAGAFTMEALDKIGVSGDKYVKIVADKSINTDAEGNVSFAGALVNLKSNTRSYAGVAYIEVTKDGATEYFYSAYDSTVNARTAEQIADAMIAEGGEEYLMLSVLSKNIVDDYANGNVSPEEEE